MRAQVVTAAVVALTCVHSFATDQNEEFRHAIRASGLVFCDERDVIVRGPLSIAEVEEEELRQISDCGHCPQVPFGYMSSQWQRFKQLIKPGDALVFFHCGTKGQFGLLEGYAIIRDGKVWKTLRGKIS